jgi:alpha-glucosidase
MAACLSFFSAAGMAPAQDERRVQSPGGQVEFQIFIEQPPSGELARLSYQILYRGKRLIDSSRMAFLIYEQEPLLGENAGMISSRTGAGAGYRWLVAEYMQNGSLGRRMNVEVRVFDNGVAFRYVIPPSSPLMELQIEQELTEFHFAQDGAAFQARNNPVNAASLSGIGTKAEAALPFVVEQPGVGWVEIAEARRDGYPAMSLHHTEGTTMETSLSAADRRVAYEGTTPFTGPWRIVTIAASRQGLALVDLSAALNTQ